MVGMEEKRIDFKYNLGIYFSLVKKYKHLAIGTTLFLILIQLGDLGNKFLLKTLVDSSSDYLNGLISKDVFTISLVTILAIFSAIILTQLAFGWFRIQFLNSLEANMMLEVKKMFFNHLLRLSYKFHVSTRTGALISKLIRSSAAVERMSDTLVFNFIPMVIEIVIATASLAYFDITSSLIVIGVIIIFIAITLYIRSIQQRAVIRANESEDVEKAEISNFFTNIESIKYFGKEHEIIYKYKKIGEEVKELRVKEWNFYRWINVSKTLAFGIGTALILYFPMVSVLNKTMTIGTLVFIYTVYSSLYLLLMRFDDVIRSFYRSMADFQSLFKYYKIQNEVKDEKSAKELKIKSGEILFENVSFSYGKRKIFNKLDLKVPKNKKVALVGPSGSGKSTLVKLLYRLYDVESGRILIDGEDIKKFKQESLRSELSIVPQECILFDDTIYNNIAFSNPTAGRNEVLNAMKFSQLDKIVATFPQKEDTIVGERGIKLSGGEKQRVSIARAILANKKILVLDEATSSLDSETEHEIQKDLENLMKDRTTIIIAHRLSTIMKADAIVVIEKGKILQIGTHNELIKTESLYKKLWSLQKGGYL